MERRSFRRTVVAVGLTVVFLIAACAIVAFFAFGGNLKEVSVPSYVIATRVGDRFDFTLDLDRLIWEQHLPSPCPAQGFQGRHEGHALAAAPHQVGACGSRLLRLCLGPERSGNARRLPERAGARLRGGD